MLIAKVLASTTLLFQYKSEVKDLGLISDKKLTWKNHLNHHQQKEQNQH